MPGKAPRTDIENIEEWLDDSSNLNTEDLNTEARELCTLISIDDINQSYEDVRIEGLGIFDAITQEARWKLDSLLAEVEKITTKNREHPIEDRNSKDIFNKQKENIDISTLEFLWNDKNIKIVFDKIQAGVELTEKEEQFSELLLQHNNNLEDLFIGYNTRIHESINGEEKMGEYMIIYSIVNNKAKLAEYYQDVAQIEIKKLETQLGKNGDDAEIQEKINFYKSKVQKAEVFRTSKWQELANKILRWEDISDELDSIVSGKGVGLNNQDNHVNNSIEAKSNLKTPNGKIIKWVTGEEWKKMSESWEYYENFITLYSFLEDNNLLWVWKYRQELINATDTVNLDLNDNSLTEWELVLFGRKLIKVINVILNEEYNWDVPEEKRLIEDTYTLNWVESELRKFTWAWSDVTNHQTHGFSGTDKVINSLEKMWIIWWTYFHTMRLRDMMDENKNKPE